MAKRGQGCPLSVPWSRAPAAAALPMPMRSCQTDGQGRGTLPSPSTGTSLSQSCCGVQAHHSPLGGCRATISPTKAGTVPSPGFFHIVLCSSTCQAEQSQHPAVPEAAEPQRRALVNPSPPLESCSRTSRSPRHISSENLALKKRISACSGFSLSQRCLSEASAGIHGPCEPQIVVGLPRTLETSELDAVGWWAAPQEQLQNLPLADCFNTDKIGLSTCSS